MNSLPPLKVLYEDNHCLVIDKPARVLSMGDETGEPTVLEQAKAYLKEKYRKPGDVYLGVVHRLDRPTSGVLLFARTSKAAGRLSDQFRRHVIQKTYLAQVEGIPRPPAGMLVCHLSKDRENNLVSVVPESVAGAQRAELSYSTLESVNGQSLLEIKPKTGRSHQIRVQLADLGTPIVGDSKYGAEKSLEGVILLHATALEFEHPTRKDRIRVEAPLPEQFGLALTT